MSPVSHFVLHTSRSRSHSSGENGPPLVSHPVASQAYVSFVRGVSSHPPAFNEASSPNVLDFSSLSEAGRSHPFPGLFTWLHSTEYRSSCRAPRLYEAV